MIENKLDNITNKLITLLFSALTVFPVSAQVASDWTHKKELYACLNSLSDSIYIQDRASLDELSDGTCTKTEVRYFSTTKRGERIQISIKTKPFIPSLHYIKLIDTSYVVSHSKRKIASISTSNKIDSTYAFGIYGEVPKTEMSTFVIIRNNVKLKFDKKFYTDFYNMVLCENLRSAEVYVTLDGSYLYIYLHGGDGKATYTVKFIFDRNKYITRIVNTHPCLKDFDFIDGFGACE